MRKLCSVSLCVLAAVGCAAASAEEDQVSTVKQEVVSEDVFDCQEKDGLEGIACELLLARVNEELDQAGITIDAGGILYTYDDPTDENISTGHSCTVTAKLTHKHAEARISGDTSLDTSGSDLREPFAVKLNMPVSLSARADVKQRFGKRFFGSCSNYASDSYSFNGSVNTTADVVAAFALNPSFSLTSAGDFKVVLRPTVAVATQLQDTDINFRISGVSPVTSIWTHVAGFSSTLARATTAAFQGDSIRSVFGETALWDFGVPVGLALLGGPTQDLIFNFLEDQIEIEAEREAEGFGNELGDRLTEQLQDALDTDSSGKRTFIIDRDYSALLQAGGSLDDLLVAPVVLPSGSSCTWRSQTGAGGPWGSVKVYVPTGPCQHRYKEVYYGVNGQYVRTNYRL